MFTSKQTKKPRRELRRKVVETVTQDEPTPSTSAGPPEPDTSVSLSPLNPISDQTPVSVHDAEATEVEELLTTEESKSEPMKRCSAGKLLIFFSTSSPIEYEMLR